MGVCINEGGGSLCVQFIHLSDFRSAWRRSTILKKSSLAHFIRKSPDLAIVFWEIGQVIRTNVWRRSSTNLIMNLMCPMDVSFLWKFLCKLEILAQLLDIWYPKERPTS